MKPTSLLISSIVFSISFAAIAAERGYSSRASSPTNSGGVLVAGSIAAPSAATATYTNPAGLVGIPETRLALQAGSNKPMENPTYRALLMGGNGMVGAAAGVKYFMRDNGTDVGYAAYGLALSIPSLGMTVGAAGYTGIKTAEGTDFNAGLLFRPTPLITLGATAMGLKGDVDSYGFGGALELANGVDLVVDSAFNGKLKGGELKPGLRLSNAEAGLSASYGTGSTAQFAKDFSAAAFFKVGANSELEFEYNHGGDLPKYFASLSFGF